MNLNAVDRDLRRQTHLNQAIAEIIAERNETTSRKVIARALILHLNYEQRSKMSSEEAAQVFVEGPINETTRGKWNLLNGLLILLIPIILVGNCVMRSYQNTNSTATSAKYVRCEADLKPKLNKCMANGREDTWKDCGEAYMARMSECTGR